MPRNVWQPGDSTGGQPHCLVNKKGEVCRPVMLQPGNRLVFRNDAKEEFKRHEVSVRVTGPFVPRLPGQKKKPGQPNQGRTCGTLYWAVGRWYGGNIT